MILHQVESLAAAGVTDIVLAVNYRPDVMVAALKKVSIKTSPLPRPEGPHGEYPDIGAMYDSMRRFTTLRSTSLWKRNHLGPPDL